MDTSWMVYDYPSPPDPDTKEIKGIICVTYKFDMEVPTDWDESDILEDMYDNIDDYQQDLDEIEIIDL